MAEQSPSRELPINVDDEVRVKNSEGEIEKGLDADTSVTVPKEAPNRHPLVKFT